MSIEAETIVPTRHGDFRFLVFRHEVDQRTKEHVALVRGDRESLMRANHTNGLLVRIHSECMTSEVFGSLKCDCSQQLDHALGAIARERDGGMVVYLRQEGRGIGLVDKIRAYALQEEEGLDTVDANRALGLPDDARLYNAAADLLVRTLGVSRIRLMTNNLDKCDAMSSLGISVVERVPCIVHAPRLHPLGHAYVKTKQMRMRHVL